MTSPTLEGSFADQFNALETVEEQTRYAAQAVKNIENALPPEQAYTRIVELGRPLNIDFTSHMTAFQGSDLAPIPQTVVEQQLPEAAKNLPMWKRAMLRTLKTVDWYVENINKPAAAGALTVGSKLLPGEQSFDKEFEAARRQVAREQGKAIRDVDIKDTYEILKRTYENADTAWGVKGAAEIIFDPLNLVGFGIPGKLAASAPKGLKPILMGANYVDQLPNVATAAALKVPVKAAKSVPGVGGLLAPHSTSIVEETRNRVHQGVASFFGTEINSGNPGLVNDFIARVDVGDMQQGDPFSIGNMWNHLEDILSEGGKHPEKFDKFALAQKESTPREFAENMANMVAGFERDSINQGGKRISLDPFEGLPGGNDVGNGVKRTEKIKSVLTRMQLDDAVAEQYAKQVNGKLQHITNTYLQKIEPLIVRPWSLAHLAFTMFGPMNVVEDSFFSLMGMNSKSFMTGGMNDAAFRLSTANLLGDAAPSSFLLNIQNEGSTKMLQSLGLYGTGETGTVQSLTEKMTKYFGGDMSNDFGRAIRRGAWNDAYQKSFYNNLRTAGADESLITELKNVTTGELPPGLEGLADDIHHSMWLAVGTGDSNAVREMNKTLAPTDFNRRAMTGVLEDYQEIPLDVRRALKKAVWSDGINAGNVEQLRDDALEGLLDWHKFTPQAVEQRYNDFLNTVGQIAPKSQTDAVNMLYTLSHASNALKDLPNEMQRHAQHRARQLASKEGTKIRDEVWLDVETVINESMERLSKTLDETALRVSEQSKKVLSEDLVKAGDPGIRGESANQVIDRVVQAATNTYNLNKSTWQEVIDKRKVLFETTPKNERGTKFWFDEFYPAMDAIWDSHAVERANLASSGRSDYISLLDKFKTSKPRGIDEELYQKGFESVITDMDDEIAGLMRVMAKEQRQLAEVGEESLNAVNQKISNTRIAIENINLERGMVIKRNERLLNKRQHNTIPELQQLRKQTANHKASLRLAQSEGFDVGTVETLQQEVAMAYQKEVNEFGKVVPNAARPAWENVQRDLINATNEMKLPNTSGPRKSELAEKVTELQKKQAAMMKNLEKQLSVERATTIGGLSQKTFDESVEAVLKGGEGSAPSNLEEVAELLESSGMSTRIGNEIDRTGQAPTNRSELIRRIYSKAHMIGENPQLSTSQADLMKGVLMGETEIFPTKASVELVEKGLLNIDRTGADGIMSISMTDDGIRAYKQTPFESYVPVDDTPPGLLEIEDSTIGEQWKRTQEAIENMRKKGEELPDLEQAFKGMEGYTEKIAKQMDDSPELMAQMKDARQAAGREANEQHDRFFINYDGRNSIDFFMQRLMPFWMYESRRWKRLAATAGSKPVLGKYMAQSAGDWDYGYAPPVGGFEFNPMKGTILGGMRRLGARDFPEYHSGFRGGIEQGLDWMGRFGFYLNPPITAGVDIMQGQVGNIAPPPLALLTQGSYYLGAKIPGIEALTLNSRYMDFLTDQIVADKFKENPQSLRTKRDNGDEVANQKLYVAQKEAARNMIIMQQASFLRYRPASKTNFIKDQAEAIQNITGITKEQQEEFQRVGVPLYSVIAVSGQQRKAMAEQVPNYEAWIAASNSLRPLEEQKALRRIDKFWQEVATMQDTYTIKLQGVSTNWEQGKLTGVAAQREYKSLVSQRTAAFEAIKGQGEFADVPVTLSERQAWTKKFGGVPPMVHPVDEAMETYYSIDPEAAEFVDEYTGETNWSLFYEARDQILDSYKESPLYDNIQAQINKTTTALDRGLKLARPYIQEYYGVRDNVMAQLAETNPELRGAASGYRDAVILSERQIDPNKASAYSREARDILVANPMLLMMEAMIRKKREELRANDPAMEHWYKTFIAAPKTTPSAPPVRRGGFGGAGGF